MEGALAERWQRLVALLGTEQVERLLSARVMVVGVGGVGAMAAEALARSAVGTIILVDSDNVQPSNLNRQILATQEDIGRKKVEVMKERILSIHPKCQVITHDMHYDHTKTELFAKRPDYVIDAIDTITCKLDLLEQCAQQQLPCISCLGMGNRMDPSQLVYTTLDQTSNDPLAKAMRAQARKRGMDLKKIQVVFSTEEPLVQNRIVIAEETTRKGQYPPSSSAFVPNAAGLLLASKVVRDIITKDKK